MDDRQTTFATTFTCQKCRCRYKLEIKEIAAKCFKCGSFHVDPNGFCVDCGVYQ